MSPRAPPRLPLLFRLDEQLNIADGFYYALDCRGLRDTQDRPAGSAVIYCGGDFTGADFEGTIDEFQDTMGSEGGHAGCSTGCSGGCSGGCGGGD